MMRTAVVAIVLGWRLWRRTPEWVAHRSWGYVATRVYIVRGKRGPGAVRVLTYDHSRADGALVHAQLRENALPPRAPAHVAFLALTRPREVGVCTWWVAVRMRPKRIDASDFLALVAHVCAHSGWQRDGHDVVSTVLVSKRHTLVDPTRAGCFLRTARVAVHRGSSLQTIANAHRAAIDECLAPSAPACDSLEQRAQLLTTHYLFNKWMLDTIERTDGRTLRVVRGGHRVSLAELLAMRVPLEIKCVREGVDRWVLLATPLPRL